MQEIVAFCDNHFERDGSRVLGEGYRIGITGEWRRIDLCQECMVALLGPLEKVMKDHVRAVADVAPELLAPRTTKPGVRRYSDEALERKLEAMNADRQCLWCPRVIEGGYKALKTHLMSHGFSSFEEAYGSTCPICRTDGITRLSGHIGRAHLVKLPEAFEWAYWGEDSYARGVANNRRAAGAAIGVPAQIEGTLEKVEEARKAWVKAHGEP